MALHPVSTIFYRKLGREKAIVQAHQNKKLIETDSRLKGRKLLTTIIHEIMHLQNEDWSESKVERLSTEMGKILWKENYRKEI